MGNDLKQQKTQQEPQCSASPNVYEKCVAALIIATGAIVLIAGIVLLAVLLCQKNNPPKWHVVATAIIAGGGGIGYGIRGWKDKETWNSTLGMILKVAIPLLWGLPFMGYLLSCFLNKN